MKVIKIGGGCLKDKQTIGQILEEPYVIHNLGRRPEQDQARLGDQRREVGHRADAQEDQRREDAVRHERINDAHHAASG